MAEPVSGSCLCGAIRFSIDAPVAELRACHCRNCQKASGAGGSVKRYSARPWAHIDASSQQHRGQPDAPAQKN
jgi:hypothetical protein